MSNDWNFLSDTLRKVGAHRERIGAKSVKEVMANKVKVKKKKKVVNRNKKYEVAMTSKEKAHEQREKIRQSIDNRVKEPKRRKVDGGYIE